MKTRASVRPGELIAHYWKMSRDTPLSRSQVSEGPEPWGLVPFVWVLVSLNLILCGIQQRP